MNRRSFLSAFTLSAAAIAVDPEMLGWTKRKSIFVPPASPIVYDKLFGVDTPAIAYYLAHDGLWELTGKESRLITPGMFKDCPEKWPLRCDPNFLLD